MVFDLQKDKRTQEPKIFVYVDKVTNTPKGECTVTYDDPPSARAAINWFNSEYIWNNFLFSPMFFLSPESDQSAITSSLRSCRPHVYRTKMG